jgi:hypothetical protein
MVTTYNGRSYNSYQEYRLSKHWKSLSTKFRKAKEKAGCCVCHETSRLIVMHKRFMRSQFDPKTKKKNNVTVLGHEKYCDLMLICLDCNDLVIKHGLFKAIADNKILNKKQLSQLIEKQKGEANGSCQESNNKRTRATQSGKG